MISRIDYELALQNIEKRRLADLVNFIKGLPLFQTLSRTFLTKLTSQMQEIKVFKNKIMYREDEPVTKIYIVKEGNFEITRRVQVLQNQMVDKKDDDCHNILKDPLASKNYQQF